MSHSWLLTRRCLFHFFHGIPAEFRQDTTRMLLRQELMGKDHFDHGLKNTSKTHTPILVLDMDTHLRHYTESLWGLGREFELESNLDIRKHQTRPEMDILNFFTRLS